MHTVVRGGKRMKGRYAGLLIGAAVSLTSSTALAGPVEILDGVSINPADPSHLIVPYRFGGRGMFVSQDGGKTLSWLCSAGISTSAVNHNGRAFLAGDGYIYLGLFDGLIRGQGNGCGFAAVPELDKKWIADIASDPLDAKRTYVVTTNPMVENHIHMNDGSGAFVPFGTGVKQFLDTLDVVQVGEGRRFYLTGVTTNVETNEVKYSVRVSDDNAMTWTEQAYDIAQFGPMDKHAEFAIVAINPTNPDHIVGRVWRKQEIDTLVYSTAKGVAGSWQLLAEPTEVEAIAFTSDGALYFGDSDQNTKAMFVVDKVGEAPRLLNESWKPYCLGYDKVNKRLLGCSTYYLFGEVDMQSGGFKPMLDLRCAEHIVDCPGQEPMMEVCRPQAEQDFCHVTHWVLAPLCEGYDRGSELANYQMTQSFTCMGGFAIPKPESAPATGAAGSGTASTGTSTAASRAGGPPPAGTGETSATAAGSKAPLTTASSSSGGCNIGDRGSSDQDFASWLLSLGVFVWLLAAASPQRVRTIGRGVDD